MSECTATVAPFYILGLVAMSKDQSDEGQKCLGTKVTAHPELTSMHTQRENKTFVQNFH